ncbi:two-component regulator propeller domain-containing protein [Hallella seregens]|nr:two-component regulator propeller domain-containing protein [Hallella seregens]
MKKIWPLCFIIIGVTFLWMRVAPLHARQKFFMPLDTRGGLSENHVKSILQDHWGFMWFGTKNGLNRYDGTSVKRYQVDDKILKIGNQNVSALFEDKQHQVWVGTDKGVYIFDPITESFRFFNVKSNLGVSVTDWIAQITSDSYGNIWIIAPNQGAFRYELSTKSLTLYNMSHSGSGYKNNPSCICVRKNGEVWVGTDCAGLLRYNPKTKQMAQITEDKNKNSLRKMEIYTMCDYGSWIAIADHEGKLMKYNPTTNTLTEVAAPNVHYKLLRALLFDGKDLVVGTQDGLFFINEQTGKEEHIRENTLHPYGLTSNMIYSLYLDHSKGLWIGTIYNGVDYLPGRGMLFNNYIHIPETNSVSSRNIRELYNDSKGRVWIASEEGNLDIYDPRTGIFKKVPTSRYKGGNNRLALLQDGEWMMSGIFKNGIDLINIHSFQVKHLSPDELGIAYEGSPYALFKDGKGRIWLGTGRGIYIKKGEAYKFSKISMLPDFYTQDIAEDKNGNIWIATIGSGIFLFNPHTGRSEHFEPKEGVNSVSANSVSSITFDHLGNPWFATDRGGICHYDLKSKQFTSYSESDFLPDNVTYKMLEDKRHHLWFGTNHGLVCLDPSNRVVAVFNNSNGLISNQFSYKSAVKTATGKFLFGSTNGLVEFNPLAMVTKTRKVFVTNIRVNGHELRPGDNDILKANILLTDKIRLPHDMNNVSFDVSNLDFGGDQSSYYEYMLEDVDKEWLKTPDGNNIAYSQLQPGKYTLLVRPNGNEKATCKLTIIIDQPWQLSIWAKLIYLLLLCALVYYLLRRYHLRQVQQLERRELLMNEKRDKELLKAKISFFTDITHELRTPLTLINGSVESITEEKVDNPKIERNINAIDKNCKRLLNLTNQLLDFRKIDSNVVTLSFTSFNVCKLMTDIVDRFEPAINNLHKLITLDLKEDDVMLQADREAFTKIISNMLNNAWKYSESFIQVEVSTRKGMLIVAIINDGIKIPEDKTEKIFLPFIRLDGVHRVSGSGIGLPMARSLAELHGGTLAVDSSYEYNKFVLTVPLKQDEGVVETGMHDEELTLHEEMMTSQDTFADDNTTSIKSKEYTALLVEDNIEVARMVAEKLGGSYNVIIAENGEDGLAKLKKNHVDIVISDIMMPVMDGLQMTQKIKTDMETSHIPIILLTARQTMENNIEGLKSGADAYIVKPFSMAHLLTQIQTLLENRKRERESFVHKPYLPSSKPGINKADEEFLKKMTDLIVTHINQPEFNVEQLASSLGMSRSSLHRKIKDVSNLTPVDFIRLVRLKKAAELIRNNNYRVTEVCEMVGISSPSYFIKLFHKQFGMTPKEFADKKE